MPIMKLPFRTTFLVLHVAIFFLFSPTLRAESSDKTEALKILKDPLKSTENRGKAIDQLLISPSQELQAALIELLKNPKESIPFRHIVEDGLVRFRGKQIIHEMQNILFDRSEKDLFARQTSLAILWKIMDEEEKKILCQKLFFLVQDTSELPDLRSFALGYLNKASFIPQKNADWAQKILLNKTEASQVRASAITYIENLQGDALSQVLTQVIQNGSGKDEFRQAAILKAARMDFETLTPVLKGILANQKEEFNLRRLCLDVLINSSAKGSLLPFLNQTLAREKGSQMQNQLESAIAELQK